MDTESVRTKKSSRVYWRNYRKEVLLDWLGLSRIRWRFKASGDRTKILRWRAKCDKLQTSYSVRPEILESLLLPPFY